jgi:prophage antirepressor-like protein
LVKKIILHFAGCCYFKTNRYYRDGSRRVYMNDLAIFKFGGKKEVRTLERDGEPWFVAKDVCGILGLGNVTEALRNFPKDEILNLSTTEGIHEGPGNPNVNIVNEPGLYRLIFQSRKPEAEAFKTWVFTEVLPSLRKTGEYSAGGYTVEQIQQAAREGIREITDIAGGLLQNRYPGDPLHDVLPPLRRVIFKNGYRMYIVQQGKCKTRVRILVYNSLGEYVRVWLTTRKDVLLSIAGIAEAGNMGQRGDLEEVEDDDIFQWHAGLAGKRSWKAVLEFKLPEKQQALGAK